MKKSSRESGVAKAAFSATKSHKKQKRKPNAAERQLAADWEKLIAKHSKPLEKGQGFKTVSSSKKSVETLKNYKLETPSGRETPKHPSRVTPGGEAAQKAKQTYTGTEMVGVSQMHKSNMVPVFNREHNVQIARMRRG